MFTDDYEEVQLEALTYLTGECNYGGRVTDNQDRRLIMSLLNSVYHKELLLSDSFPLTESGTYCIPLVSSDFNNYLSHIKRFPLNAAPEVTFDFIFRNVFKLFY